MVAVGIAVLIINTESMRAAPGWAPWAVLGGMIGMALTAIGIDASIRRKDLTVITAVYFGVTVGMFLTYVALLALTPILQPNAKNPAVVWLPPVLGTILCYVCTSLLLQTKDDFRFIIPYVEFARDVKGLRPNVLDSTAIVDGRVADLAESGIFESRFVVPSFIVEELHAAAESSEKQRRLRGKRGLDILSRLRSSKAIDIEVLSLVGESDDDGSGDHASDDARVVAMARRLGGRVITNDMNLVKMAGVRSVQAININDIAISLKPTFVPGDALEVRVVKPGEEPGQGVGYLDDGTMVVVEGGRDQIGRSLQVSVTGTLQTTAGRLVFAKPQHSLRA